MKHVRVSLTRLLIVTILFSFLFAFAPPSPTGMSLSFDGVNDYVSIGHHSAHSLTTALTLEAWIKPASSTIWESIVGNIWWTSQNVGGYAMWMAGGSDPYYVGFGLADVNDAVSLDTASLPGLDQWSHVACTYDGSYMVIYVNGDTAASKAHTGEIVYDDSFELTIGRYYDDTEEYYYHGLIDEVRIWNVARTRAQIRDNDNMELTGNEVGLIGYWKLNEGLDTIAVDDGGSYDGALTYGISGTPGGPTWIGETGLPVELTSFGASAVGMSVTLSWTTATEVDNAGWEVERREVRRQRSEVGSQRSEVGNNSSPWVGVGFVAGAGTVTSPKEYAFVDQLAGPGSFTYRLKQIDRDGTIEYSEQVEVTVETGPTTNMLVSSYPNPFNASCTILFTLSAPGFTTLKVFDISGRHVATLASEILAAGIEHRRTFDASRLPSGMYYHRLGSSGNVAVGKLVVLK